MSYTSSVIFRDRLQLFQSNPLFVSVFLCFTEWIADGRMDMDGQLDRRRLHGGDRPHGQKVVGAMPQVAPQEFVCRRCAQPKGTVTRSSAIAGRPCDAKACQG